MRHVDEGLLHAWLDGERAALEPGAADEVRRHLAGCGECRARLEEARGFRTRAEALLRGGDPAGVEGDVPPFEALAARAAPARHGRGRMLAWAASLALALGAGWLAHAALDPGASPTRTAVAPRPAPPAVASPRTPADASPGSTGGQPAAPAEAAVSEQTAAPQPVPAPSLRVAAREEGGRAEPTGGAPGEVLPDVSLPPPPPPPPAAMESAPPASAPAADVAASARVAEQAGVAAPRARTARRAERAAPSAPAPPRADSAGAGRPALGSEVLALEGLVVTAAGSEAGVLAGAVGPDAEGWFSVRPDAPRRLLGREPLRVRGLPTVSVQVGRLEGRTVVRVRQRLAGGGLLSLVQEPGRPAGAAAPGDSSSLPEARDEVPAEQARLVRRVGGITVTASAPLPSDALARLLDGLR